MEEGVLFSLFLSTILFVGNSCVNFGFGSVCDLRCEKECCFHVLCFFLVSSHDSVFLACGMWTWN